MSDAPSAVTSLPSSSLELARAGGVDIAVAARSAGRPAWCPGAGSRGIGCSRSVSGESTLAQGTRYALSTGVVLYSPSVGATR